MDLNPNRYSGQPTFSRDVTDLMRRVNALEARANLEPAGSYFRIYDFDVWEGRVYVLVERNFGLINSDPRVWRIQVYDAVTGTALDSFALPEGLYFVQNGTARPRICVGDGYIFLQYRGHLSPAIPQDGSNSGAGTPDYPHRRYALPEGKIYRFSINGDGLTTGEFETYESWYQFDFGAFYRQAFDHDFDPNWTLRNRARSVAPAWGSSVAEWSDSRSRNEIPNFTTQLVFSNGYVVGVYVNVNKQDGDQGAVTRNVGNSGFLVDWAGELDQRIDNRTWSSNSLCIVKSDLSALFWKVDYKNETTARIWFDRNPSYYYPQYRQYIDEPVWEVGSIPHWQTLGGVAVHNGKIYLDCGGETPWDTTADIPPAYTPVPDSYLGTVTLNDDEIEHPQRVNSGVPPFVYAKDKNGNSLYTLPELYATNGTYLYSTERFDDGTRGALVQRNLLTGAYIQEWAITGIVNLRCQDNVLWLNYGANIQARNADTFDLILEFVVGDARKQTEWFGISSNGDRTSLGTPDGGATIPTDDALTSYAKSGFHILQLRDALTELAPSFRSPLGNAFNLEGTEDENNLYYVAMGDRTKYGATDGAKTSWTRGFNAMTWTSIVTVSGDYTYVCIKEHRATANNKPGVGGQWETYWRTWTDRDIGPATEWQLGAVYGLHKTYDIDIGEVDECITILEGSELITSGV